MTAAVYIDGFNLYYGMARPLDCKWVDLQAYFESHFPDDDIRRIYFFEAMIQGSCSAKQRAYISALESRQKIQVVLGEMKKRRRHCQVEGCGHFGPRSWTDFEEKHTDVSLGIQMIDDTHRKAYDKLILVSGDTDLVPAVRMTRLIRPQQKVLVCIPGLEKYRIWGAKEIGKAASRATRADPELFIKSQFEDEFIDDAGNKHHRPDEWRRAPKTAFTEWKVSKPDVWLKTLPGWCK